MSVMFLGFRSTNSSFQRPILLLLNNSRLHCSSSQTSPNLIEDFLPWLQRKSGVEISSTLSIGNSIYGRSLFASKAIREGDCIMQVPFSVKLTPYNLPPEIESLLGDDVGNVARLAVVVLVEQKLGQDSQWTLYINSLPRHGELHSTVFWSNEEMEMVRLSSLYMETVNQKVQIEKEFLMIRPVFDRFPQYFEDITWKDFLHAYALVGSRAWGNIEGLSLVPFADFLNHDGVCEAVLLSDNHRRLSEVIADRNYAPGEQVLIRYGKFSNSTLLLDFGFTLPYNIYDQVEIRFSVPQHDPLCTMKLELLHKHRIPVVKAVNCCMASQNSFIIKEVRSSRGKGKGIPQTLRAFARILSTTSPGELQEMEMEAEQNDGRLARRPLKNVSREIEAHHMLHTEVMHLIQEYDASVKTLRRVNHPSNDEKYAHRNQLAHDLLTGELRVLKSVSSWLTNYCATLSAQIVHSF